jgi:hypothetical protein
MAPSEVCAADLGPGETAAEIWQAAHKRAVRNRTAAGLLAIFC